MASMRSVLPVLFLLGAAVPVLPVAPTLVPIQVDGVLDDWSPVLANPRNVSWDGEGSSIPCAQSIDRDCSVPSNNVDLRRFAWTYDERALYLFLERYKMGTGTRAFYVYIDGGADGKMQANDWVAAWSFSGPARESSGELYRYVPANPMGDPLQDALGMADGYTLPGIAGALLLAWPSRTSGSTDGMAFEQEIPWADLGLPPGTPLDFHVSTDNNCCRPENSLDNCGGPDDRAGSTRFFLPGIEAPLHLAAGEGRAVEYPHVATNRGNLPDRLLLEARSLRGIPIELWSDTDRDGDPELLLFRDRNGDGSLADPGDLLTSEGDPDGDTLPDTDVLPPAGQFPFVLRLSIPVGFPPGIEITTLGVRSSGDPDGSAAIADRTSIGRLNITPDTLLLGAPGEPVDHGHVLWNESGVDGRVNLDSVSPLGWPVEFWSDPDGDGTAADGARLPDSDGDSREDAMVPDGSALPVVARIFIPAGAPTGSADTTDLEATLSPSVGVIGIATDQTRAAVKMTLDPDHTISSGTEGHAGPGGAVFFSHYITNAASSGDSYTLTATSTLGSAVTLYTDPDGDGNPADGWPILSAIGPVTRNGGKTRFVAKVTIPVGTPSGATDTITLTARSVAFVGLTESATDEAVVSRVVSFRDPLYQLNAGAFGPCETIYAQATGLAPEQTGLYRFAWWAPAGGAPFRTTEVSSDSVGEAFDAYQLAPGDAAGGYRLDLEEWTGLWLPVDSTTLNLERSGTVATLRFEKPSYDMAERRLLFQTLLRSGNALAPLLATTVRWVVTDPSGTLYLRADGAFVAYTGAEWTHEKKGVTLAAGEEWGLLWSVLDVVFPQEGDYDIRVDWTDACGTTIAAEAASAHVSLTDSDGDTLPDDIEIDVGIDPHDADTDDDGLLDQEDGMEDTDGDTWIDARDCDSDNDNLPDGLEAGLVVPKSADTNVAAGCFFADTDPATVTNPDDPDTDGGGVLDGMEDADHDGAWDALEKDPLQGWDDPCSHAVPAEVTNLRVRKAGSGVSLSWDETRAGDSCAVHRLYVARSRPTAPEAFLLLGSVGSTSVVLSQTGMARTALESYLIVSWSPFRGEGPWGFGGR